MRRPYSYLSFLLVTFIILPVFPWNGSALPIEPISIGSLEAQKTFPVDQSAKLGVINSSASEIVPDIVLYSLLFRFVSSAEEPAARSRVRHYLRQIGLGNQARYKCSEQEAMVEANYDDADIDAFMQVADEFHRQVRVLDQEAIRILLGGPISRNDIRLVKLQRKKEQIVAELINSLPDRLGSRSARRVLLHVSERMRKGTTMHRSWEPFSVESPPHGAEYSDAYTIDESGQDYDPSTDTVSVPDSAPPPQMVGLGVSEISYSGGAYSTATSTQLAGPGQSVSAWSQGATHAVAEAISLQLDPQTTIEGDYNVSSEHTYYLHSYLDSHNPNTRSLDELDLGQPLRPEKVAHYYTSFSSFIRPFFLAYQWAGTTLGCPNNRFAYLSYCANAAAWAPCNPARVCAPYATPFSQGFGLWITQLWGSFCVVRHVPWTGAPICS